ncbi:MAG: N-acetylmuramoyl-L-alanine amidase family protein, partial [Schaalia odontolytica]
MRPINVRTLMIAAVSAAVLAGTVVPANAAELTDPGAPTEVAAEEQPATDGAATEEQPADDAAATEEQPADGAAAEEQPADNGAAAEEQPADDGAASWKQDGKGWWFDLGDGT